MKRADEAFQKIIASIRKAKARPRGRSHLLRSLEASFSPSFHFNPLLLFSSRNRVTASSLFIMSTSLLDVALNLRRAFCPISMILVVCLESRRHPHLLSSSSFIHPSSPQKLRRRWQKLELSSAIQSLHSGMSLISPLLHSYS
jgi:hypothetical protein